MNRRNFLLLSALPVGAQLAASRLGESLDRRVLLMDSFSGPDGTALSSHVMDSGSRWTIDQGGWVLTADKVTPNGAGRATVQAGVSDLDISVTVAFTTLGNAGLILRQKDPDNYLAVVLNAGGSVSFTEVVDGIGATLLLNPVPLRVNTSYCLRVQAFGNLVSASVNNGYGQAMAIDRFQAETSCGMIAGPVDGCKFDDFVVMEHRIAPLPALPRITAENAAAPLLITTYDGRNQVVHPSVIDTGKPGWQGHRYWMSITPYPGSDPTFENPCIYCSDDGDFWTAPSGLLNPIEPRPADGDYNSDSELAFGPDGRLYCFWRRSSAGEWDQLFYGISSDGVTWSEARALTQQAPTAYWYLSPTIVYVRGRWRMWVVANSDGAARLMSYTASDLPSLGSAPPIFCPLAGLKTGNAPNPWHQKIIYHKGLYRGVFQLFESTTGPYALHYGESVEGINWNVSPTPFLRPGPIGCWDDTWIYRSSFTPANGHYDLWYSGRNSVAVWALARTRMIMTSPPRGNSS